MAAARAAARREAILKSGGNRLAKLTSSARGDDPGGVYAHDDPPLPTLGTKLENFVGEETDLPKPPASPSTNATKPKPTAGSGPPEWDPAQQQEFMRALMGGVGAATPGLQLPPSSSANPNADPSAPPVPEDPISTLLASLGGGGFNPFGAGGGATTPEPPPRPRTLAQKLLPVLHALSMLIVLVWFVGWKEPEVFVQTYGPPVDKSQGDGQEVFKAAWDEVGWKRWARLARDRPVEGLAVPALPAFFWAFTTLQLALHSLRLFSEPSTHRPPMLIGLVLPYLPPWTRKVIDTSLKYLQLFGLVLDDLSILIFGIGLVIFVSNWLT